MILDALAAIYRALALIDLIPRWVYLLLQTWGRGREIVATITQAREVLEDARALLLTIAGFDKLLTLASYACEENE
jgi:hypothetical protein